MVSPEAKSPVERENFTFSLQLRYIAMDKLNELLSRIDLMIAKQAIGNLTNPKTKDSFGFGTACGIITGLNLAKQEISIILNEDDDEKPHFREA